MRVESPKSMHNGGWWHPWNEPIKHEYKPKPKIKDQVVVPDLQKLLSAWHDQSDSGLDRLAARLELSVSVLNEIGAVYSKPFNAYAFPMYTPDGRLTGIRLRNDKGEKWAVKGSKAGLFIPFSAVRRLSPSPMVVVEGPTDAAAGLAIGFFTIGRHACQGQEEMVACVQRELAIKHIILIYDNDAPGIRGAEKLAKYLKYRVTKLILPCKDLREFVINGGTKELLVSIINNVRP